MATNTGFRGRGKPETQFDKLNRNLVKRRKRTSVQDQPPIANGQTSSRKLETQYGAIAIMVISYKVCMTSYCAMLCCAVA